MNLFHNIFGTKASSSKEDIQDYLQDKASTESQKRLESNMADNPFLSDAVDGFLANGGNGLSDVPSFEQLQSQRKLGKVRRIAPYINRVAALLLGVMAISGVYYYWEQSTPDRMYAAYFDEFQDPKASATRDAKEQWHPYKQKAVTFFSEKNYESSILYWEKYQATFPDSLQAPMFIGYCYLKLGESQEAIRYLKPIANTTSEYIDESRWYLALAYLRQGDSAQARPVLEDIRDTAHPYYADKAQDILQAL